MAESPRALAARWAAFGLEMDDELTGEPSRTIEEAECMSDVHDELLSSMDVIAVVHAQDAEGEQQSERVSVECVGRVDDGAGGGSSKARRGHEGEGGVEGCEGADGVEQGASMAAREVEGDDEDEDMAGVENISMQRAEGGGRAARQLGLWKPNALMIQVIKIQLRRNSTPHTNSIQEHNCSNIQHVRSRNTNAQRQTCRAAGHPPPDPGRSGIPKDPQGYQKNFIRDRVHLHAPLSNREKLGMDQVFVV